jgi:hypothetical protein
MSTEAFHSTIKDIHHALEVKTPFSNSTLATGFSIESNTEAWTSTNNHHRLSQKRVKRRNLHTKSYKAKLERLRSARLTHRGQAAELLDMQKLQVVKDT